ncbi:MAG: aquaporin [Bacilli bacterium]|nr:aquaporin [Bacilli bacterium]
MKKYLLEFFGSSLFVFFGTGIGVVSGGDLFLTSLSCGVLYTLERYLFSSVCNCHLNTAVSISHAFVHKMSVRDCFYYSLFQILGSITGMFLLFFLLSETNFGTAELCVNYYGEMSVSGISCFGAFLVEFLLTTLFVFLFLMMEKKKYFDILIGSCLFLLFLFGIPLIGMPSFFARSLAPAIFLGGAAFSEIWVFLLADLSASVVASYLFCKISHK